MPTRHPEHRAIRLSSALAAFLTALFVVVAGAHGQTSTLFDPERLHFTVSDQAVLQAPGELRFVWTHLDPVPITLASPAGQSQIPLENAGFFRVRLTPKATFTDNHWKGFQLYQLVADFEAVHNNIFVGDQREPLTYDPAGRVATGRQGGWLTQAYGLAASKVFSMKMGLMRSSWGMGILANAGEEPARTLVAKDASSAFGYPIFANRVVRAQFAWTPLRSRGPGASVDHGPPLVIAVAGDAVVEDNLANWKRGDRTYHGVLAIQGRAGPFTAGLYGVYRHQKHWEGGETNAGIFDIYLKYYLTHGRRVNAWFETEIAMIAGSTNYTRSTILTRDYDIFSGGGVARLAWDNQIFTTVLEGGFTSADDNPFDDRITQFTFDRSYKVGLLMFGEMMRTSTAVSAYNIADPAYRGEAPSGFSTVPTAGAVRGASYINPRVRVKPIEELAFDVGFLWASASADYADPFQSGLGGGFPTGPNGAEAKRDLGWEVDLGASYQYKAAPLTTLLRVEWAYYKPGDVFASGEGEGADGMMGFWLHAGAQW